MAYIYPSLMGADQLNLQRDMERLQPYCQGFHIDVMDNIFVPNMTWGPGVVNAIARISASPLWVHLMVKNPMDWEKMLFLPKGSILSFHFESNVKLSEFVKQIREKKYIPSLAVSPETPLESIFPILNAIDHVLLMSVNPGFAGQQFLQDSIERLDRLNAYRQTSKLSFKIGIDGGINKKNIKQLAKNGVDDFAVAGAVFLEQDSVKALNELKKLIG